MKTIFNDRIGHRGCKPRCLLVTLAGDVFPFGGHSIAGVCHAARVDAEKAGKWSNTTWEISHAETTSVIQWMDDWNTGMPFPQTTWEEGFFWVAEKAPTVRKDSFESCVRTFFPSTAERWDAARAAEAEFGFPATEAEIAAIRAAQERIEAEKAAHEKAVAERRANSPFAKLLQLKTSA